LLSRPRPNASVLQQRGSRRRREASTAPPADRPRDAAQLRDGPLAHPLVRADLSALASARRAGRSVCPRGLRDGPVTRAGGGAIQRRPRSPAGRAYSGRTNAPRPAGRGFARDRRDAPGHRAHARPRSRADDDPLAPPRHPSPLRARVSPRRARAAGAPDLRAPRRACARRGAFRSFGILFRCDRLGAEVLGK